MASNPSREIMNGHLGLDCADATESGASSAILISHTHTGRSEYAKPGGCPLLAISRHSEVVQRVRFTPKSGHLWGWRSIGRVPVLTVPGCLKSINTEIILYVTSLFLCGLLYGCGTPGSESLKAGSQCRSKSADEKGRSYV